MTLDLGALAMEFVRVRALGQDVQAFLAEQKVAHPEFANDIDKLNEALSQAIDTGNIVATLGGSLAGGLHSILAGHGEQGKHSAHFG